MNSRLKRRLIVTTGILVVVIIVVLAIVGGSTGSAAVSVAQAQEQDFRGKRVQVSGKVVDNSYSMNDKTLAFMIYDEADPAAKLAVEYDGAVAATFGNQITAICTGVISEDGVLICTELVTKCPSKYENSSDALEVSQLVGYGASVYGKPVKVQGVIKDGTFKPAVTSAGSADRFTLQDATTSDELKVDYNGALSDDFKEGSQIVVSGALEDDGTFVATDVALKA